MRALLNLIENYGLLLVFGNVLLEQLGLPLPAYPTLIIAGALLIAGEQHSAWLLLTTAVAAALIADFFWFYTGRRYGTKVLSTLCRISLSPDSCVNQTESVYARWGSPSLVVAKFIPGFASVASALAGTVGTRRSTFLLFDGIGAALWAGLAIFLGTLFSTAIDSLLDVLTQLGKWGSLLVVIAFVIFIGAKWWERYRFLKSLRMARISVTELSELLREGGDTPVILDVRSTLMQQGGRIPGAVTVALNDLAETLPTLPEHGEVIVYCACPNEASAARVAKLLMQQGYSRVRPLAGGIDAWVEAGHAVEV